MLNQCPTTYHEDIQHIANLLYDAKYKDAKTYADFVLKEHKTGNASNDDLLRAVKMLQRVVDTGNKYIKLMNKGYISGTETIRLINEL